MSDNRPEAVLFDLDGTLVNTFALWVEVFLERIAAWGGTTFTEDDYFERVHTPKAALASVLDDVGIGGAKEAAFRAERDGIYVARLREEAQWIDAADGVLRELGASVRLGVVTQSRRVYFDAIDARLDVQRHLQVLVTHDETGDRGKPDPHGLLLAAGSLDVDPVHCVYVGDQPADVEASQRAGMQSVLIRRRTTRHMPARPATHTLDTIDHVPHTLGLDS